MRETLDWIKDVYTKAHNNAFEWKPLYPNNARVNGVRGLYTDMFFERHGKYVYVKFTIEYVSRCDSTGLSHPEEGVKYYVLHELTCHDLEERFNIPEPSEDSYDTQDNTSLVVNNYGRYRYVFDDVETAQCVVANELRGLVYPYTYLLADEERVELSVFLDGLKKDSKQPVAGLFDTGVSVFETLDDLQL